MDMHTTTTEQPDSTTSPNAQTIYKRKAFHRPVKSKLISKYLTKPQAKGLMKLGDVLCPGDGKQFPKFSKTSFSNQTDRMLDYMVKDDREGVALLLSIFSFLPKFVIKFILSVSEKNENFPDFIGAPLRMIYIGLRGLIYTLYYSNAEEKSDWGGKIFKEINWDSKIVRRDGVTVVDEELSILSYENPSKEDCVGIYSEAKKASRYLKKLSVKQRLRFIEALKEVILTRSEEIVSEIQKETKKSRSDAMMSEIFGILDHLDFLLGHADKSLSDTKIKTPLALMGKKSRVFHEPVGTVLIISPWNYPFYQAIVPITTAFVTGNATIYKPSEFTPLQGLVESVLEESGFDSNWVQMVYGDGQVGSSLIDQRPDKIFFTGSVRTGKRIMAQASEQLIPVELELGGKDPMIVFEDANIARAAAGAVWGAFTNLGQSCTSVERCYVHEDIYDEFKNQVVKITKGIKQDIDPNGDADVGYMTTQAQVEIIATQLKDALSGGAKQLTGDSWDFTSPNIPPIVIEETTFDMDIVREETFGPILPLIPFSDEAEVVGRANDSEYGLSASVWTADKKRGERVARQIQTGNVSVNNVMLTEGNHHLPFGGTKMSGMGRYKGVYGLHSFSNIKSVLFDSNSSNIEVNWYPYTKKKYQLFKGLTEGLYGRGIKSLIKFAWNGLSAEGHANKTGKALAKKGRR